MDNYHLIPDENRWKLKLEGGERSLAEYPTKGQAVAGAIELVRERRGSLKIHREDGIIEEEHTYLASADPLKSPG